MLPLVGGERLNRLDAQGVIQPAFDQIDLQPAVAHGEIPAIRFVRVGTQSFQLGSDLQTDAVMARRAPDA